MMKRFIHEFTGACIALGFLGVLWLMFASLVAGWNGVALIGG